MNLRISLPFRVFADYANVARIVADTPHGAFGILPRRLDCVAILAAGILTLEDAQGVTHYVATDAGVLVKHGPEVHVSVRHAIGGQPLGALRAAVAAEFSALDESERQLRHTLNKLEQGFVRRFAEFQHG